MSGVDPGASAGIGPTFVIVGAMKAGTSSLHEMLAGHPEVFATGSKELHYWDNRDRGPIDDYHQHFLAGADRPARGESSPSYAYVPGAIKQMAAYQPSLKLIYIMRDPVKRAVSHLQQAARRADGVLDMHAALDAELLAWPRLRGRDYLPLSGSYHARGHYRDQIDLMHSHFPADQVLLLRMEDMIRDEAAQTVRLCRFLGVAEQPLVLPHANKARRTIAVADGVTERLREYYAPLNLQLHESHGIRVDDWL